MMKGMMKGKCGKRVFAVLLTTVMVMGLTLSAFAVNPIITNIYTADPAPMVYNNTFYIYCDHDEQVAGGSGFLMKDYHCLTSTDMVNWTDHLLFDYKIFNWAIGDAWAPQCVQGRDGKFYMYCPVNDNAANGWMSIGVAVADSPLGPFKDAKGTWLINDSTPNGSPLNIDPTVFIDDDGQAYIYWGSYYGLRAAKLNSDMISLNGSVITPSGVTGFWEAPWLWKRNGVYYLAYAAGGNPATIDYCTASNPMGPWTYKGRICDTVSSPTNHSGIAEYKGQWYFVYHNAGAPGGGEFRRSVCVDYLYYNADGTIKKVVQTTTGVGPAASTTPTPTPSTATLTPSPSTVTPTPTPSTATPTPTPSTATPTPTPTTATPTPTPTAGTPTPGGIKVQFFNGNTAATTNTIYPSFKLVNTGTAAVNLSDVKMRYYFTNDGTQADSFACDWATVGNGNITGTFTTIAKTNADRYLEVGFTSAAGTLAAGAGTEVKGRIWKSDWSNFTQTNDYSFNSAATNYVDSTKTTGYISDALKWGTEP